jgi:integrase
MTRKKLDLTLMTVRSLKPRMDKSGRPARTQFYFGDKLYVICQPSGLKTFALRWHSRDGIQKKHSLGTFYDGDVKHAPKPKIGGMLTVAGAKKLASDALLEIEKGDDPSEASRRAKQEAERKQRDTFRSIATEYMKREVGAKFDAHGEPSFENAKLRTARERWMMLERSALPTLGSKAVSDIKKSDIIRLLDRLADGELKDSRRQPIKGGDVSADRLLAVLRKIFSWHASREDDFRSPIVSGMNRVKPSEQSRDRVLNADELRAVWTTASKLDGAYPAFVKFSLLTCSRRSEAAELEWSELSKNGDWLLPARRNKARRDLLRPLSKAAQDLLATLPRTGKFVFSTDGGHSPISGYSKHKAKFDKVLAQQGTPVADYTIHDLRRTARSLLSAAGISRDHAEQCLGHVQPGVVGIYDRHAYYDEKKRAFEALAAQIERTVSPPDGTKIVPLFKGGA